MSTRHRVSGLLLASAAAALFAGAGIANADTHEAEAGQVKCSGINACKGTSACKTASNACKGHNACKGTGVTPTASAEECQEKGGTVVE